VVRAHGDRVEGLEAARELFGSAVERVPANAWYRLNLAHVHTNLEEWVEAAAELEVVVSSAPDWFKSPVLVRQLVDAWMRAAKSLFTTGRYGEAAESYARLVARYGSEMSTRRSVEATLGLADSRLAGGHFEEAVQAARAALEQASDAEPALAASAHARLALVAGVTGDVTGAGHEVEAAIALAGSAALEAVIDDPAGALARLVESGRELGALGEALGQLARGP
jgi:tetratricopeptide (TPR) repeat protein